MTRLNESDSLAQRVFSLAIAGILVQVAVFTLILLTW